MAAKRNPRMQFVRRRATAALAVVGWVLVMMVAAGPRPNDRTWIGLPVLDDLMGVLFLALVVWAIVWTVRVVRVGGGAQQTRSANLITLWLGLAVAIAILMVNPSIVERLLEFGPEEVSTGEAPELSAEEAPTPADFEITATQVYVALAAVGAWIAVTAVSRRRDRPEDHLDRSEELTDGPDLGPTIDAMVDDLELGSDPRSSVLAAYHRLERVLAEQDRPRRLTETPAEHLDRVLAGLPINRVPFLDLARRYELARFSDHTITEADRARAASDLAQARDDLRGLAAR